MSFLFPNCSHSSGLDLTANHGLRNCGLPKAQMDILCESENHGLSLGWKLDFEIGAWSWLANYDLCYRQFAMTSKAPEWIGFNLLEAEHCTWNGPFLPCHFICSIWVILKATRVDRGGGQDHSAGGAMGAQLPWTEFKPSQHVTEVEKRMCELK